MNCTTNNTGAPTTDSAVAEPALARAIPACDVWEAGDGVHIVAEMPGVEPGAVEVTIERDVLTLRGKAARFRATVASPAQMVEYVRRFRLSDTVEADATRASCKNGLVSVLVPKKQPTQRKIAVSAG